MQDVKTNMRSEIEEIAYARKAAVLPSTRTTHWLTDPLSTMMSFYVMVEQIAAAQGLSPDSPRHLNKVAETK